MHIFYELVYQLTGIIILYCLYVIVSSFKDAPQHNLKATIAVLVTFNIVNNIFHYYKNIPILNMISTIALLMSLGWVIGLTVRKILLSTAFTMFIIGGVEVTIAILTGATTDSVVSEMRFESFAGRIATVVLIYAISIAVKRYKHVRSNVEIPISYWLVVLFVPTISLSLLLMLIRYSQVLKSFVTISASLLLAINMIVFSLYDRLLSGFEKQMEDLAIHHLNDSYKKQLELMKESLVSTKAFKHDLNRHVYTLDQLLSDGDYQDAKEYLERMKEQVSDAELISNTGNPVIDSIVNFEFSVAALEEQQISITTRNIPKNLSIEDYDLTTILSNVLRNAFFAASQVKDGYVNLSLDYHKGMFSASVDNSFTGEVNVQNGQYMSIKRADRKGFGLSNMFKVVGNYNGEVKLSNTSDRFSTTICMYAQASRT